MRIMRLIGKAAVARVIEHGGELETIEGRVTLNHGIQLSNSETEWEVWHDVEFDKPPRRVMFACAFFTGQAYGGPEEGGWWYETGEHLLSLPFFASEWRVEEQSDNALREPGDAFLFDATARETARETVKSMCAAMGHDVEDEEFTVFIDSAPGCNYPRERPTYC